jgi:hypothetical protein
VSEVIAVEAKEACTRRNFPIRCLPDENARPALSYGRDFEQERSSCTVALLVKRHSEISRLVLVLIGSIATARVAAADPVIDFFQRLGKSVDRAGHHQQAHSTPPKRAAKQVRGKNGAPVQPQSEISSVATPNPPQTVVTLSPTPTPVIIRVASVVAESSSKRRDIPYGVPVPNKPGYVTSPYAPSQGLVDVRDIASGTEVKDPYTGKIFLTP